MCSCLHQIGLAVVEVMELMKRAKKAQIDMKLELIFDYELLRLQFHWLFCGYFLTHAGLYGFHDMNKFHIVEEVYKNIVHFFTYTTYIDEEIFQSVNEIEDKNDKQISMLISIKEDLFNHNHFHISNSKRSGQKQNKNRNNEC